MLARLSRKTFNLDSSIRSFASLVKRNPAFATLQETDVTFFRQLIGDANVITQAEDLQPFNRDWMNKYHGQSKLALKPNSTQQVSKILEYCNQRKLAVVPQGGNTGLVGGSVPIYDEIVLSLSRMNQIEKFDPVSGVVVSQSGVILEQLDNYLAEHGFMMPLDLGAKGSCHIGGNISTNAGGLRYVRYGSLHGTVLGLETVLPDGRILDTLSVLRKDNTGFDLKQLFIGGEGTLGVITKASILVPRRPKSVQVAYLACESYEKILATLQKVRVDLGEILSAVEFEDRGSLELVLKIFKNARDPLSEPHPFYMLIETAGSNSQHDTEKLNAFLESALESGLVLDGTLAQDATQMKALWQLREGVAESASKSGAVYKYDVSLPTGKMYWLVEEMKTYLANKGLSDAITVGYGHLGDGNLHLNIVLPKYTAEYTDVIEPHIFELVAANQGSISAEHGVGQCKPHVLHLNKGAVALDVMHSMKQLFDPNGIMNPYKVLPTKTTL